MKTYSQWLAAKLEAKKIAKPGIVKKYGLDAVIKTWTPDKWWNKEILPKLESGEKLSLAVCRSIVKNGGGYSLAQINNHYSGAIPVGIDINTGILIKEKW